MKITIESTCLCWRKKTLKKPSRRMQKRQRTHRVAGCMLAMESRCIPRRKPLSGVLCRCGRTCMF